MNTTRTQPEPPTKIALCRQCHGSGTWHHNTDDGKHIAERCPLCEGSGRVIVTTVIKPFREKSGK